jgi:hypothetical protein
MHRPIRVGRRIPFAVRMASVLWVATRFWREVLQHREPFSESSRAIFSSDVTLGLNSGTN